MSLVPPMHVNPIAFADLFRGSTSQLAHSHWQPNLKLLHEYSGTDVQHPTGLGMLSSSICSGKVTGEGDWIAGSSPPKTGWGMVLGETSAGRMLYIRTGTLVQFP